MSFPTPWYTTPLSASPLAGNSYSCKIVGLSASTIYEYRAYAVIDGIPYCGNILTGTTCAMPASKPSVTTGCAYLSLNPTTSIRVSGNTVTNNGDLPIAEYGVLYTQNAIYGTPSALCYENVPALVCKKCLTGDIAEGTCYFTNNILYSIIGLSDNTQTYYRAFARNSCGSGYGIVKTQMTANAKDVNLCLYACAGTDGMASRYECHCLVTTPPMVSGECYTICLGMPLFVDPDLVGVGYPNSCSSYCVYCVPGGIGGSIMLQSCDLYSTSCSPDTPGFSVLSFTVKYNDIIRIYQKAITYPSGIYPAGNMGRGGTNSCACIKSITNVLGSGSFAVGTTCRSSCAWSG